MRFMSEHEVDDMLNSFDEETNLIEGARTLYRLKEWTNQSSDGWAYWPKPVRAANKLMELLQAAELADLADVESEAITDAFRPIKAFLTRQGVEYSAVFYTNKHARL